MIFINGLWGMDEMDVNAIKWAELKLKVVKFCGLKDGGLPSVGSHRVRHD